MLGRIALRALPQMGLMQAPSGVVIVDTELRIAWANQAAGRLADGPSTG